MCDDAKHANAACCVSRASSRSSNSLSILNSFHHSGSDDDRADGEKVTPLIFHRPTFIEIPEAEPLAPARERPNRLRNAFRNGWGRFLAWNERLENSFLGDVLAASALNVFLMVVIVGLGVLA